MIVHIYDSLRLLYDFENSILILKAAIVEGLSDEAILNFFLNKKSLTQINWLSL